MLFKAALSSKKNLAYVLLTAIFTWALLVLPITYFQLSNPSTLFEQDSWGSSSSGNFPNKGLEEKLATNSVEFWYQFTDVNPQTGHLSANVYLWPSQDLATPFSSSTITKVPIKAFVDNISQNSLQQFSPGDAIGAIPVVLDMTNPLELERANEFYYPFDEYSLDNYAKVEIGSNNQNNSFQNANTYEFFYEAQIPGFEFYINRGATFDDKLDWFEDQAYNKDLVAKQRADGKISNLIQVTRSGSVKYTSLLIFAGILFGSIALLITTIYVARAKRPPSMTALIWAAASILGITQMRLIVPGEPRLGILLDLYSFFPSLIICIASSVILAITWVRRENFKV
jgi:hypothetical protein